MDHNTKTTLEGRVDVVLVEPGHHHRIVVERPTVRAAASGLFQTRAGSGVALVGPWSDDEHVIPFLLGCVHGAADLTAPVGLLVGLQHAGEAAECGAARSRGVLALLQDDKDAWVTCATEFGGLADIEAFLHYLNAMHGWGCAVHAVDGAEDEDAASAVLAFQQEFNEKFDGSLLEDGVCGTKTLGAVFDVTRDDWAKWLKKHDLAQADVDRVQWAAADEAFASRQRGAGGLDVWLLEQESFEGGEVTAQRVYDSKVSLWDEYPVPPEPWAWAAGPFTIVTDLPEGEVVPREEYRLWSSDAAFDMTLAIPDDAVVQGVQTLRFLAVPADKDYSLSVSVHGDAPSVLFTGVPYNQLHNIAQEATDDQEGV